MTDYIVLPGHAGVDEAGRGCLVGSVFAAAVMLPAHYDLPGLTDSKKLSEAKRDALAAQIKRQVTAWAVGSPSASRRLLPRPITFPSGSKITAPTGTSPSGVGTANA